MSRRRLVILGGGWAGFSLLKSLPSSLYDITVVSPRNHFLFTPLLAGACVGTLDLRSITEPLRSARSRDRADFHHHLARAHRVDLGAKAVVCQDDGAGASGAAPFAVPYDDLVLGVGMLPNDLGVPGVGTHALFLKEALDAQRIRARICLSLERAVRPNVAPEERRRLLSFALVGGGPTGIEMAAELADLVREDVARNFPEIRPGEITITLFEANIILGAFHGSLRDYTMRRFRQLGIRLVTSVKPVEVTETGIRFADGTFFPAGLVVWSTGLKPHPFVSELPFEHKAGRVVSDMSLRVIGHDDIWVAGDCAAVGGSVLPATAQVAAQEGKHLALALAAKARGKAIPEFSFKNRGMLSYVGGFRAIADLGKGGAWSGFGSWLFWRSAYLTNLVSIRNKVLVPGDWLKTFIFGRDLTRF